MSTTFRPYAPDQSLLLPPDVREWLPEGHLAHHVSDLVDGLDLTAFYGPYEGDGRRNAPYEPRMMVKVLVYAYATGVPSAGGGELSAAPDAVRVSSSAPGGFPGAVCGGGATGTGLVTASTCSTSSTVSPTASVCSCLQGDWLDDEIVLTQCLLAFARTFVPSIDSFPKRARPNPEDRHDIFRELAPEFYEGADPILVDPDAEP